MSELENNMMKHLLEKVQEVIHEINPFVREFKQIVEMPEEELQGGKIVISAKGPADAHDRRYNLPTNLKEVSIIKSSQSNDMVLRQRDGGLRTISELHPKGMSMHFTLLFPYGTSGWDQTESQKDGKRRVTPRQFFSFHLNVRGGNNMDFLHRTGHVCPVFSEFTLRTGQLCPAFSNI